MGLPSAWTPELVLRGLRLHFDKQPQFGQYPASFRFLLERARTVLDPRSLEFIALTLRTAPAALSLREMVRAGVGWHRSRSELYRRSHNGAIRIAVALRRDGIPIPEALLASK